MLWNGLSSPLFGLIFEREASRSWPHRVCLAGGFGGCYSLSEAWGVGVAVIGDAPEAGGSEPRQYAVRESRSQLIHAQMVSSE
jgi:hypothetical protein